MLGFVPNQTECASKDVGESGKEEFSSFQLSWKLMCQLKGTLAGLTTHFFNGTRNLHDLRPFDP